MGIATPLVLIAAGAISRLAVSDSISGVDPATVGPIVGVVALIVSPFLLTAGWRGDRGHA